MKAYSNREVLVFHVVQKKSSGGISLGGVAPRKALLFYRVDDSHNVYIRYLELNAASEKGHRPKLHDSTL